MKKPLVVGLAAGAMALLLSGCVTINIYFPAAAAEKAADRIIDEIMQQRGNASTQVRPPQPSQGEKK